MHIFPFAINYIGSSTSNSIINSVVPYVSGNITAVAGVCYDIPKGSLISDTIFGVTDLTTDGDYIEIANRDDGFRLMFVGQVVYDAGGNTYDDVLAFTVTRLRRINGKLTII